MNATLASRDVVSDIHKLILISCLLLMGGV